MARLLFTALMLGVVVASTFAQYRRIPGTLIHITASPNYLWGTNRLHYIYLCSRPCNGQWKLIDGRLMQVDANDYEVWGVNSKYEIYKRPVDGSGNWTKVPGLLKHVSASGNGYIWGVNRNAQIYKCKKPCSGGWERIAGRLKQIDGGQGYVYGVSDNDSIYRLPVNGGTGEWQHIPGALKHITGSGQHDLFGVNRADQIFRCKKPCTGYWERMSGLLAQCDATVDGLVGVNSVRGIWHRTIG